NVIWDKKKVSKRCNKQNIEYMNLSDGGTLVAKEGKKEINASSILTESITD
ncbi:unnamed protein product, partial [Sphenostylis stenocarpa]